MSYIVGLFLLHLDENLAFIAFSNLVTQSFMISFYKLNENHVLKFFNNFFYCKY